MKCSAIPKYVGRWSFGLREFRRHPTTRRRVAREREHPDVLTAERPELAIAYDFDQGRFVLTYLDGSAQPWSRVSRHEEVFDVVSQFLTRRAGWYKPRSR